MAILSYSMSVNVATAIASELAAAVAAETFTLDPTVRRGYVQDRDLQLEEIAALRIDVQASDCDAESASREAIVYTCRTDLAVREKFAQSERETSTGEIKTSEIDARLVLMQQLLEYFARDRDTDLTGRRLTDMDGAIFEEVEFRPQYYPAHLRDNGQFTGIISVVYKVYV